MLFFVLPVPFFQISNDYCQKSYNGVQEFLGSSNTTQTFLIFKFWQRNSALLNFFEIWIEMHFVSLCFLNERNITTSLLMIHLKCTVVHYSNLNSSSVNKPLLNYGQLNMLFLFFFFFRFLIYVYFHEDFVKKIWSNYHFLNANFRNSFQDVVYYKVLGGQTLWY